MSKTMKFRIYEDKPCPVCLGVKKKCRSCKGTGRLGLYTGKYVGLPEDLIFLTDQWQKKCDKYRRALEEIRDNPRRDPKGNSNIAAVALLEEE